MPEIFVLVADSLVLSAWEDAPLRSAIEPADGGDTIKIYTEHKNAESA